MAVIHLTDEQKKSMMEDIAYFFDSEYDEQIGLIKQMRILEFFTEELAPVIYNKALDDMMVWYKRQQDNMESDFYALYRDVR